MQAQARRVLARRRFVAMQTALYPQRSQTLEARVLSLATELRGEDEATEALRARVADVGAQVDAVRARYETASEHARELEAQLDDACGRAQEDVSQEALDGLRRRLDDAQTMDAERERQIEDLLAKLADVERQGYAAATSTAAVSRALEEAKERMEDRLHSHPSQHQPSAPSSSRWAGVSSPTLRKLDRTSRSPKAPPPAPKAPNLTLQIPDSEARDEVTPLSSTKRSASMRLRKTPVDPSLLSTRAGSRFSMPPQSASSPSIKVTIVRQREAVPAPPPKRKEDVQRKLEAFYKPVFSPTTPGYGLRAVKEAEEEEEEKAQEKEELPAYAEQLLAQLSQSDLTLGNGEGGEFSLRVGNSRIMATLEHAAKKQSQAQTQKSSSKQHARKESRPGLFKIFGLR
ncbi:hypothetical protein EXIGLDRAFT_501337 [Exidia glandulosa HHB12029]|uniref:Uncharacterized protein n=1 Tax=Exidia glandulosa HHB12029 TaxID=1314781 RepID=A0A165JE58_EXIGL|nr:hypothetical protein EXIGLDRAFT_501337 [Exidia glandulosa HHB12029]